MLTDDFVFKTKYSLSITIKTYCLIFVLFCFYNLIENGTVFDFAIIFGLVFFIVVGLLIDSFFYKKIILYQDKIIVTRSLFFKFLKPKIFKYKNIRQMEIFPHGSIVSIPSAIIIYLADSGKEESYSFSYTSIDRNDEDKLTELLKSFHVNVKQKIND